MRAQTPVLECKDLCISYFTRAGEIPAVVDFNLTVMPGEAVGIVGEFGLRQVDRGARDHAVHGQERPHHVRRDQVQGPRHDRDERGRAAPAARLADRDGLSGADGLAQSVDEDRAAADGGAAVPRGLLGAGGLRARARDAGQTCACPIPGASWRAIRTRSRAASSSAW